MRLTPVVTDQKLGVFSGDWTTTRNVSSSSLLRTWKSVFQCIKRQIPFRQSQRAPKMLCSICWHPKD